MSEIQKAQALVKPIIFTDGDETVLTASAATVGTWVKLDVAEDGTVSASYDADVIKKYLEETVSQVVSEDPIDRVVLSWDDKAVISEGEVGRKLQDVTEISKTIAETAPTAEGYPTYKLPFEESEFKTTTIDRKIDINLKERTVTLIKDGKEVAKYPMSPGLGTNTVGQSAPTASDVGEFRVYHKTEVQTMSGSMLGEEYETPNVKWNTFYNGGEAMHGAYWHNMFGKADMSHGCINLSEADAKAIYDFAPIGTPVSVHY